jgi:phospholipid/cholesterol/gamma-HCH transport system substrate-binding protein
MARQIRKYSRDFSFIIILLVAGIGVGGFILTKERLRLPLISGGQFTLNAAFSNAQAITPGQGQTVRVSGVQVGEITGVKLQSGVAIVTMRLDDQYRNLVHEDATILQRPKTALDDEFLELDPGTKSSPLAPAGFTLPVQNTLPQVNFDQLLSSLDGDTRDYLQLLIGGAGQGLYNRGHALQAVFEKFLPTHEDLEKVNSAVATRHANLSRLIHSLNLLNGAIAQRGPQLEQLIRSSSTVFGSLASESGAIQQSVSELPGTLDQTTATLGKVQSFANVLAPTTRALLPAAHSLVGANAALIPFAQKTTPVLRNQIRPFVVAARPLVRSLEPAAGTLSTATPNLTSSFVVLNHLFNLLAFNKSGASDSVTDPSRQEGFLFWLAWLNHNAASVFGDSDANGTMRRLTESADCSTIKSEVLGATSSITQSNEFLTGLVDLLLPGSICGSQA